MLNKRECGVCSLELLKRPCILVEGIPHCFRCAKVKVGELDKKAHAEHHAESNAYQAALAEERIRQSHIDAEFTNPLVAMVWGIVVGSGLVFIVSRHETMAGAVTGAVIGLWHACQGNSNAQTRFGASKLATKAWNLQGPRKVSLELVKDFGEVGNWRSNYRVRILMRDNNTCQNCGCQPGFELLEVHHIQTRADNGPDHPANLVSLCHSCHDREKWFGHVRAFPKTL